MIKIMSNIKNRTLLLFGGIGLMMLYSAILKLIGGLPDILASFFIYGALIEEITKFIIILYLIKKNRIDFVGIVLFYLGYGIGEQASHLWLANGEIGLIAPIMHITTGLVVAHFIYPIVKTTNKTKRYAYALMGAIVVHGIYNEILRIMLYFTIN